MTPKEKAQDLVQRFVNEAYAETTEQLYTPTAKKAALIAVGEILNVGFMDTNDLYDYWHKVRKEIENL